MHQRWRETYSIDFYQIHDQHQLDIDAPDGVLINTMFDRKTSKKSDFISFLNASNNVDNIWVIK